MRKGLFATLEDETGLAQQVGEQGPVVPEVVAEVAEGSAELSQDAGEVGDLVAQVEDAQLADQELQQVADTMQQSIDEGTGLDTGAAQMAEIATESIMNRLGLKGQRIIPATESFGSSNSRVAATRIAIESVGEKIKAIWEGILKFLKMVWQKITDFFAKFFSNSEKMEKAAEELKKKVVQVQGEPSKEQTVPATAFKAFNVGGKVNINTIGEIIGNHISVTKNTNDGFKLTGELIKACEGIITDLKSGKETDIEKTFESLGEKLPKAYLGPEAKISKGDDGSYVAVVGPFVDGINFKFSVKFGKDKDLESITFETKEDESKVEPTLEVLNKQQLEDACNKVIELAKATTEYKKNLPTIKKVSDESIKLVESIITIADKYAEGQDAPQFKKNLSVIKTAVTSLSNTNSRVATMLPAANVRAGNRCLNFVSASLKAYKVK